MTTDFEELVRQFESWGTDAPFFAEVARRRIENTYQQGRLMEAIEYEVNKFVDTILPKPVFERPNHYNSEEDLDFRIIKQDARQYVRAKVQACIDTNEPEPSKETQKQWFDERLRHLARLYCEADEIQTDTDTARANAVARDLLADFEIELAEDLPSTGHQPTDSANNRMRERDRHIQKELEGTNFVYFGHTNRIDLLLYRALLKGYNPTAEQLKAADDNGGHDFLWDEITELHREHHDVSVVLDRFGYGSNEAPSVSLFVGAFAVPREVITELLTTLYLRGQSYRQEEMGFPWSSEEFTEEEAIR